MVPAYPETIAMRRDFWTKLDGLIASSEIKLIIGCTEAEIVTIEKCHNGRYMSCIIIRREGD